MNQLQKALLVNAVFSGISGMVLVAASPFVAHLFETTHMLIFRIMGLGLLLFTAFIFFEIKRKNLIGVLLIIMLDFLWVLGSLMILVLQPFDVSNIGYGIIFIVALIVFFIGTNQAKALARVDDKSKARVKQLKFERLVRATKGAVWKVIADVGNYHEVAPNIDNVEIISGQEEGMVRSCSHGKDRWTETCSLWKEEEVYSFEVNTSAPDYPYPFKKLAGTWKIEQIDGSSTHISMQFDFQYKQRVHNWLLHPVLKSKFSKIAEELLDNWQKKLENIPAANNSPIF